MGSFGANVQSQHGYFFVSSKCDRQNPSPKKRLYIPTEAIAYKNSLTISFICILDKDKKQYSKQVMARISAELMNNLVSLQQSLLENVNEAKLAEYLLLDSCGETDETISSLDELTAIALQAADLYSQISRLLLQISEIQPAITPAMLELLSERVDTIENRIPALEQSIKEIQLDWGLR